MYTIIIYIVFGMHKPMRRFVIVKCKPNINLCTMSIWVSIHIYFVFNIFVYFCSLLNILYIILYYYIYTQYSNNEKISRISCVSCYISRISRNSRDFLMIIISRIHPQDILDIFS